MKLFLGAVPIILRLFSKARRYLLFSNYSQNNLQNDDETEVTKLSQNNNSFLCNNYNKLYELNYEVFYVKITRIGNQSKDRMEDSTHRKLSELVTILNPKNDRMKSIVCKPKIVPAWRYYMLEQCSELQLLNFCLYSGISQLKA